MTTSAKREVVAFDPGDPTAGPGYRIANVQNGLCWNIRGDFVDNSSIVQCVCHEGENQLWEFVPVESGVGWYYIIVSAKHPQYCVSRSGGRLVIASCPIAFGPTPHAFRFQLVPAMEITNFMQQIARPDGGDCAAVANDSFANGDELIVEACDGTQLRQSWLLLPWRGFQNDAEVAAARETACEWP